MLIPIRHEGMHARRWPIITFALIGLNLICFLFSYPSIQSEEPRLGELKAHILLMAASHPELTLQPQAQQLVDDFKQREPAVWAEAQNPNRDVADGFDAQMRLQDDEAQLQSQLDSLTEQYLQLKSNSLTERYAFIPAHPKPISYLTANFLHGGWMHLIGNMWFLWLAGFVLEDVWGRPLYTVFYLISGAAALQLHAWTNSGSMVPTLGASGAVAALMGAFLVRYPKMKIEMLWLFGFFRSYRFKAPAYALLPLWLLMEVFYGTLFGTSSGVAHWAHVGGFVFGALSALGVQHSGLEQKANRGIEEELTLNSDAEIRQASDLIDQQQFEPAISALSGYLQTYPKSVDAHMLLVHAYRGTSDQAGCIGTLEKLCAIHAAAGETDLVWKTYEDFLSAGGKDLAANVWLEVGRAAEKLQFFDRAVSEYETLAQVHPTERQAISALLSAGRVCMKLNQPERALAFFEAAEKSPVPHLDWEQSIAAGIKEAKSALPPKAAAANSSSQR
ncbi:MAG TPA: rhomboid family intramembrane serine protease [Terriglobales bacterium]|nr:rhomboid family intramembrane serine protease [Terriglobales bacterium]